MADDVIPRSRLDKQSLQALLQRRDGPGLLHLAGHLALLSLTGTALWLTRGSGWLLATLPLHGIALIFLFSPLHETIHRTAFKSRWLNTTVGWIAGAVLLLPPNYFRAFHFAHHAYTQDPRRDPELVSPKPATWRAYFWHVSGLPYWIGQATLLVKHALGQTPQPFVTPRVAPKIVRDARLLLGLYFLLAAGSIVLGSTAVLWLWVLPALVGQPFLRLYLLAEHWGCPEVPEMLQNTRTTLTNPLVRFLAWNMPYHAEHHVYSAVPFHALPKLHAAIKDRLAVVTPGYLAVQRALWKSLAAGK